jgi:hypothetical protein
MADDPSSARRPAMRVSDADRERVCALLREAFAEGRLTTEEFHERTAAALAARTELDLTPLTADLPAPAATMPSTSRTPSAAVLRSPRRRELRGIWTAWVSMAVLLNVVWLLTVITSSGFEPYWPIWPLGITGALAVVRTLKLRALDDDAPVRPQALEGRPRGPRDRRRAR